MAERRKFIIERASAVVNHHGFGATTISDVLAASKVSKGNFYHYFTGKDDLGLAIIEQLSQEYSGTGLDDIFSPMKPPLRRLSDYIDLVFAARRQDPSGDPLCSLASELGATPPYAERIRAAMTGLLDRFEALVAEFALETRASINAPAIARAMLAQIHGLCIQYKVDRDTEAFNANLSAIPALLAGSIGSPPHAKRASTSSGRSSAASR